MDDTTRTALQELEAVTHDLLGLARRARALGHPMADDMAEAAWRCASLHDRLRQLVERAS